jgi:hypothetical protein
MMQTEMQQFCIDILPIVQAGAKGYRIGYECKGGEKFLFAVNGDEDFVFTPELKYFAAKPRLTVNGFEINRGELEIIPNGAIIYLPDVISGDYKEDEFDDESRRLLKAFENGIVFLNKADAIACAKAMLGIDPSTTELEGESCKP